MSEARPPLPDGYVWARFEGGSLDGEDRIAKLPLDEGSTYHRIVTGEVWLWRRGRFRLTWIEPPP